ncbi:hypothetical protein DM01DRAFT_1067073 [Hesseltinella vesiculosa]|uniref:Uncharacterized protein n=1 Tax=Hesseltinella vesiculosa TaxID=101127 RepID=A0A1X2GV03_9FUNG|nr:hypothetical protein DM01DRAFT_1067073 [Hesseltinella vesiculosa]
MINPIVSVSRSIQAVFYGVGLFGFAGMLQTIQIPSMILAPFSPGLLVKINSFLIGTVWNTMQYIFEVKKNLGVFTFSGKSNLTRSFPL